MKLSLKAKSWIGIALFAVVFTALVLVATFFDLQISKIMTEGALAPGEYLADDVFGVTGEIIGSAPVFLLAAFIGAALFWYFEKVWKLKPLKHVLAAVFFVVCVVGFYLSVDDITGYILQHAGNKEFNSDTAVMMSKIFIALILAVLLVASLKNVKEENAKRLAKFAVAALVALAVANLVIHFVKEPVGRMRFRAMNSEVGKNMLGFENYTAWYVSNGQPADSVLKAFESAYGVSDAFKSFPSGHTCAAGMSYAAILLPGALKLKNKGAVAACWVVPFVFTGLVAASRIVCGAHFMSDVTFGGTIAFLSMVLVKEIFIDKFKHVKSLFAKNSNVPETLLDEEISC
jgi:membrane-associated phospholipid phosphatase